MPKPSFGWWQSIEQIIKLWYTSRSWKVLPSQVTQPPLVTTSCMLKVLTNEPFNQSIKQAVFFLHHHHWQSICLSWSKGRVQLIWWMYCVSHPATPPTAVFLWLTRAIWILEDLLFKSDFTSRLLCGLKQHERLVWYNEILMDDSSVKVCVSSHGQWKSFQWLVTPAKLKLPVTHS